MLEVLKKSRQLAVIALDRMGDYFALLRIEMADLQDADFDLSLVSAEDDVAAIRARLEMGGIFHR